MGVGGLFDYYSGTIPRSPLWMRKLGVEWVWRLMMEPKRMWKRYIIGNITFLWRIEKIRRKQMKEQ
jgi:N-acetylglucosaminyldiphosphoundecaprenol N-acetyl-beta-D-mannosaminyltransferase